MEGLPADRTVMIGDNPQSDLVGADTAGIDAILVTGTGEDVDAGSVDEVGVAPIATVNDLSGLFEESPR